MIHGFCLARKTVCFHHPLKQLFINVHGHLHAIHSMAIECFCKFFLKIFLFCSFAVAMWDRFYWGGQTLPACSRVLEEHGGNAHVREYDVLLFRQDSRGMSWQKWLS